MDIFSLLRRGPAKSDMYRGSIRFEKVLQGTLKSGRHIRYDLSDYSLRLDATDQEVEALANRIAADKYLCCKWDQEHPMVPSDSEIAEGILEILQTRVNAVRDLRAQDAATNKSGEHPARPE
jgi:hypothetical protein